jgi:hypothetical protein
MLSLVGFAVMLDEGCEAQRLGGCRTTEREYGLAAVQDSLSEAAVAELMAPGMGSKVGDVCRTIGVDTPLFAQIGAVDLLPDETWVSISSQLTALLDECGVRIATRSLLRHTTGTCFPPHHVDFRASGDSSAVAAFLRHFPQAPWEGFAATEKRSERRLFITAGTSLQLMNIGVDLK